MQQLTKRFDQALLYASDLHRLQVRKDVNTPYLAHLLGVCSLVIENGGTEDEAIAALLHDALEDHPRDGKTALEIQELFGSQVLEIVQGCSDSNTISKPPWKERKEAYIQHIKSASPSVRLVSSADKLYNARAILADFREVHDELWSRFRGGKDGSLWYYRALVQAFQTAGGGPLVSELERVVTELEQLVAGTNNRSSLVP